MNRKILLISMLLASNFIQAMQAPLECKESFADPQMRQRIMQYAQDLAKNFWKKTKVNPLTLCLGGKLYTIIGRLGSGEEGIVLEILDSHNNKFAFKLYDIEKKDRIQYDLLALLKTKKSLQYLNIPLIVNTQYGYSIFPYLEKPYKLQRDEKKLIELEEKIHHALDEDGLSLGDNFNEGNYLYDQAGKLWRIDFGTLEEKK